jgi:hypothetical protein
MPRSSIRFISFPLTQPSPHFVSEVVQVFQSHEDEIGTAKAKGHTSDGTLAILRDDLISLGFQIEASKASKDKIKRPVYFGEGGQPTLQYEVDGYHPEWKCGLEIEAGRATQGNAIFRDLIQAMIMVQVEHLILAVANKYRRTDDSSRIHSEDFKVTTNVASALYGHDRVKVPYGLTVIGY